MFHFLLFNSYYKQKIEILELTMVKTRSGTDTSLRISLHPEVYFKVTNELENHNGYQYRDGLNELDGEFNSEGSCVPGGLYFTNADNIKKFFNYGCYIRIVRIPTDAQMIQDPDKNLVKFRADKIVLGDRYDITDFRVINVLSKNFKKKYCKKKCKNSTICDYCINNIGFLMKMMYATNEILKKNEIVIKIFEVADKFIGNCGEKCHLKFYETTINKAYEFLTDAGINRKTYMYLQHFIKKHDPKNKNKKEKDWTK